MQLPERPPDVDSLLKSGRLPAERAVELLTADALGPEVAGKYLHWDELKRRGPPSGLTHAEWWFAVHHARRRLRVPLPLTDLSGVPFHLTQAQGVMGMLHRIDRELVGAPGAPAPEISLGAARDRYRMQSLMEEAITSSQLEGAATTRQVAKEMLRSGRRPRTRDERMIANNFEAMEFVRRHVASELTLDLLLDLHRLLTEGTMPDEEVGRLRRAEEPVSVQDLASGEVVHLPPRAELLPSRLEALCAFANEPSAEPRLHPVLRSVVLHFALAFEHPFVDGNGRTARALFYWSMLRHRYALAEYLSISRIIQKAPAQYARAFLFSETDPGDLTYFVVHQLGVLERAIEDLRAYLRLQAEKTQQAELLLRTEGELNLRQRALLGHALLHPGRRYTIAWYRNENGVVYETARQDLLALVDAGLLEMKKVGRAFAFEVPKDLERRMKKRR